MVLNFYIERLTIRFFIIGIEYAVGTLKKLIYIYIYKQFVFCGMSDLSCRITSHYFLMTALL